MLKLYRGEITNCNQTSLHDYGLSCPDCGGETTIHQGNYVCSQCGLVLDQVRVPEKGFRDDHFPIDYNTVFCAHPLEDPTTRFRKLGKIHKTTTRRYSPQEWKAIMVLKKVCAELGVSPQIHDHTLKLFKFYRKKLVGKYNLKMADLALIIKCLIEASRRVGHSIPLHTIQESFEPYKNKGFNKYFSIISRLLSTTLVKPSDYVPRIVSEITNDPLISEKISKRNIDLQSYQAKLTVVASEMLEGKKCNPWYIAISAVYYANKELGNIIKQTDFVRVFKTQHGTIKKYRKELQEK